MYEYENAHHLPFWAKGTFLVEGLMSFPSPNIHYYQDKLGLHYTQIYVVTQTAKWAPGGFSTELSSTTAHHSKTSLFEYFI